MKLIKRITILATLLTASILAFAQNQTLVPRDYQQENIQVVQHSAYTTAFNWDTKVPAWVGWSIKKEHLENPVVSREGYDFMPDPHLKAGIPNTYDYSDSGYDRGHMCPAADCKWSKWVMKESFYLSNVCPQDRVLNAGYWFVLEKHTRQLAYKYGFVEVVCGPVFYDVNTCKRIGANEVAVPDAFWRVILYYDKEGRGHLESYLVPNEPIDDNVKYDTYITDIKTIEKATGIRLQ